MITTRQAAKLLGISPASVLRLCNEGKLPNVKPLGCHRRYDPEDIKRYIESLKPETITITKDRYVGQTLEDVLAKAKRASRG